MPLSLSLSLSLSLTHSRPNPQQSRSKLETSRQTACYLAFELYDSHCNGCSNAATFRRLNSCSMATAPDLHRSSCYKKQPRRSTSQSLASLKLLSPTWSSAVHRLKSCTRDAASIWNGLRVQSIEDDVSSSSQWLCHYSGTTMAGANCHNAYLSLFLSYTLTHSLTLLLSTTIKNQTTGIKKDGRLFGV